MGEHESGHGSVYDGLLDHDVHGDAGQWAFGEAPTIEQGADPLAGVDTTPPAGADPATLAEYALVLGDDALVLSHRLSEWCSRAPDLEDDIALANIALDLLGQARLLLGRAAAAEPSLVPRLPAGSPVPAEDALAYFRDPDQWRNVRLVESENGDFAETVTRLLLASTWRLAVLQRLVDSSDPVLAAVAGKAVHEVTYHRDYAARWFVVLAQGTEESRRRVLAAVASVWPGARTLARPHPVERAAADQGFGVDPAAVAAEVHAVLDQVLGAADVPPPSGEDVDGPDPGRDGRHTRALSDLLAEMQSVARAHPEGQW